TGLRSPFAPVDELHPEAAKPDDAKKDDAKPEEARKEDKKDDNKKDEAKSDKTSAAKKAPPVVSIDFTDLSSRLAEIPVPSGNYSSLQTAEKRLCWLQRDEDVPPKLGLQCVDIANKAD